MTTNLNYYSVNKQNIGNLINGTKSFGPLSVTYNIDISVPQIMASASLYGVSIGQIVINPEHPSATLGGSIGIGEAELTLTADFTKMQLDYDIDVSALGTTLYSGSGVLFGWGNLK